MSDESKAQTAARHAETLELNWETLQDLGETEAEAVQGGRNKTEPITDCRDCCYSTCQNPYTL